MASHHLIFCHPLLILPSIFLRIRVFSKELALYTSWPKYWNFSFSINPSNEYSGLISLRIDWFDLLAVQGTLKSLLWHHNSKALILQLSAFFVVQLSHLYMTTAKTITLTMQTFVGKMMSLLFNTLSRLVIAFLPRSKCLLISWLHSLSTVILEPKKTKSITVSMFSPSICHEVMGLDALILAFWMLSFKPAFSLSSFTPNSPFRLFSFSSLVLKLFCLFFLEQGNERQESQTLVDKKDPPMFLFPLFLGSYLRYYWIHPRMEQSPVWKYWPLLPSGEKVKWLLWTKCFSQFSSVSQSCLTVCNPMNHSTPGFPVHHQLPEFTQTHAHRGADAIQTSHPLSSPSPPVPNPSQHQDLLQWVNSSHEVAKILEFQLQHQSFQWTPRTDLLQDGLVGSPCSPRDSQESSTP